jgi:hypothetical protein
LQESRAAAEHQDYHAAIDRLEPAIEALRSELEALPAAAPRRTR